MKYVIGFFLFLSSLQAAAAACAPSEAGKMIYQSNKLQFCDGTNWYDISASG